MFAVIYCFDVKKGMDEEFILNWKALTQLIAQYEGGLGSRLHKSEDGKYYAYAQWPNKETWELSGDKLPEKANIFRRGMRACYESIKTIHQLEVEEDLLQH